MSLPSSSISFKLSSSNKISLSFPKNLDEEKEVEVKEQGFMLDKNECESAVFKLNPFNYDVYKVTVRVSKKDKVIYLQDYKKFFFEEVNLFESGLKVTLNKKKEIVVVDEDGNKVIVKVIR